MTAESIPPDNPKTTEWIFADSTYVLTNDLIIVCTSLGSIEGIAIIESPACLEQSLD